MGYFEDEADEEYWLEQAEELGEDLDVDTREGFCIYGCRGWALYENGKILL